MPAKRLPAFVALALILLVQACAGTPPAEQAAAPAPAAQDPNEVPELTLNLPRKQDCICTPEEPVDYTFLEKGIAAMVAGDHIGAVQHFERYQRLESSPTADWEAGTAIAYDSTLPRSPFYDPNAARKAYRRLSKQKLETIQPHQNVLIMWDSLETFVSMIKRITLLRNDNAVLKENLEKREEAIKRLRELTLGQKGT